MTQSHFKKILWRGGCLAALALYTYVQNYRLKRQDYLLESPRYGGALDGFSIAVLSDLNFPKHRVDLKDLLKQTKASQVDMIALTGNILNQEGSLNLSELAAFARELTTLAPTFAVYGPNELKHPQAPQMERLFREYGVQFLHDQAVDLTYKGQAITIMGLMEKGNRSFLKGDALRHVDLTPKQTQQVKILLASHPEAFLRYHEDLSKSPDLVLSGLATGGSIHLGPLGGLYAPSQGYLPKYTEGIFRLPGNPYKSLLISRGIGRASLGVRVNNRPELVRVQLTASREDQLKDWACDLGEETDQSEYSQPGPDRQENLNEGIMVYDDRPSQHYSQPDHVLIQDQGGDYLLEPLPEEKVGAEDLPLAVDPSHPASPIRPLPDLEEDN
ncbi:metallophosphoesterase [Aerococcus sanguinicola]|uniref:Metallophosphoesterase n=1 Tax=Aerococcus sanguinicola TaxID=119206 RepID=A0A0X8FC89_9LACT|nr:MULTISPECIES: hypothetical protein [Aerococcus]AMB93862.1 hypothetical protein AWM72_03360 [Aerococcus sanguinicola]MDK7050281.1 hypothetical protein [Aerococcus sanguinicola]OFT95476.1 hypothetical protein HMPREF3090_04340 [Aerococcus sp. HMSC23C02]PKZ21405.1 hypothetical protein CYJ28_05720 [Aerococcus sanguinicola]